MGDRRSMPLSARERYYKRRLRRIRRLAIASVCLTVFICASMFYPVFAPASSLREESLVTDNLKTELPFTTQTPVPTIEPEATTIAEAPTAMPLPTQGRIVPPSEDSYLLYYTIAGDSLPVVSLHFGVDIKDISSPQVVDPQGLIPPNQLLIIPNNLSETSAKTKLLPDSEITYSPSTIEFDINAFVDEAKVADGTQVALDIPRLDGPSAEIARIAVHLPGGNRDASRQARCLSRLGRHLTDDGLTFKQVWH